MNLELNCALTVSLATNTGHAFRPSTTCAFGTNKGYWIDTHARKVSWHRKKQGIIGSRGASMAWDKLFNRGTSVQAQEATADGSAASVSLTDLNAPEAKRDTRRSKRVYISMPVLVKFQRGGQPYEEQTITEAVNAQGCLLRVNVALERGQKITIINVKSTQEIECRVAYVGQSEAGKTQAGVEFTTAAEYFWHIAFPPDDWNPADRKRPMERPMTAADKPTKRV